MLFWCVAGVVLVLGWCCAGAWLVLIIVIPVLISPLLSPSCTSSNRVNFRVPCLIDRIFALSDCLVNFTFAQVVDFPGKVLTCDLCLIC